MSQRNKKKSRVEFSQNLLQTKETSMSTFIPKSKHVIKWKITNQSPRDLLCDNHFQGKVILFNRDFGSKMSLFDLMTSSKVPFKPPSFRVINGTIIGSILYVIGASISSSRKKIIGYKIPIDSIGIHSINLTSMEEWIHCEDITNKLSGIIEEDFIKAFYPWHFPALHHFGSDLMMSYDTRLLHYKLDSRASHGYTMSDDILFNGSLAKVHDKCFLMSSKEKVYFELDLERNKWKYTSCIGDHYNSMDRYTFLQCIKNAKVYHNRYIIVQNDKNKRRIYGAKATWNFNVYDTLTDKFFETRSYRYNSEFYERQIFNTRRRTVYGIWIDDWYLHYEELDDDTEEDFTSFFDIREILGNFICFEDIFLMRSLWIKKRAQSKVLSEDDTVWIVEKVLTLDNDLFKFILSFLLWPKFENDEHFQDRYKPTFLDLRVHIDGYDERFH